MLFLFSSSPIAGYHEEVFVEAEQWDYIDDSTEVDYVFNILMGFTMGISNKHKHELAEQIVAQSNAYDIDPLYVLALMRTESTFKNRARSRSGALGLMQIRPRTGKAVAKDLGLAWNGERTLFDPTINVRLGVHYLHGLKDRFSDDMPTAFAAYNHGPGSIARDLRLGKEVKLNYVDNILQTYGDYKLGAAQE